jgi:hypothetical protein
VYFKYDEAGNQRYRGTNSAGKTIQEPATAESKTVATTQVQPESQMIDEATFWKQIRLYPVPVNDVLTIDWTEEVDGLSNLFHCISTVPFTGNSSSRICLI